MNRLTEIGFIRIGCWKIRNGELEYHLDDIFTDVQNNLYAFVCKGEIKYVGKTTRRLKARLKDYLKPGSSQSTNIKNNKNILRMLSENLEVDILALPDSGLMYYGQFHLNLAAGLEDSIISLIRPEWNNVEPKTSKRDHVTSTKTELITSNNAEQFTFNMTPSYWNKGFFNVPKINSQHFGEHDEDIKIVLRNGEDFITARIDRKANKNSSPRIMGRSKLKKYFQLNYTIDDVVPFKLITPNLIKLI